MGNTKISIATNLHFAVSLHSHNRSCMACKTVYEYKLNTHSKAAKNQFSYNQVWQLRGMWKMTETRIKQSQISCFAYA